MILAAPIFAAMAAPETGLYAATAIYNALVTGGYLAASGTNVAGTGKTGDGEDGVKSQGRVAQMAFLKER